MPYLKKTVIQNYRNIALQELEFSSNVNCITGRNGEGKTNLLDSIWYLSMTKSSSGSSDQFLIRHSENGFALSGTYEKEKDTKTKISITVNSNGDKKIRRDDKPLTRISEHIGTIPIVMVSPSDISLISDGGELRRNFVNSVLSQMDREYLSAAQVYNRLLKQRNSLLKDGIEEESLLETFDLQMGPLAKKIHSARREFTEKILPKVQKYYTLISGGKEEVGMEYESQLSSSELEELLKRNREKDRILKYTTSGIQRDDFLFSMGGFPIRKCGSQGQQKSFLVALKFAQYDIMKDRYGFPPILLLDDLFDKLDMERVGNLLSMVSGDGFGQIFLSDSNKVRLGGIVDSLTSERIYYEAEGGVFKTI